MGSAQSKDERLSKDQIREIVAKLCEALQFTTKSLYGDAEWGRLTAHLILSSVGYDYSIPEYTGSGDKALLEDKVQELAGGDNKLYRFKKRKEVACITFVAIIIAFIFAFAFMAGAASMAKYQYNEAADYCSVPDFKVKTELKQVFDENHVAIEKPMALKRIEILPKKQRLTESLISDISQHVGAQTRLQGNTKTPAFTDDLVKKYRRLLDSALCASVNEFDKNLKASIDTPVGMIGAAAIADKVLASTNPFRVLTNILSVAKFNAGFQNIKTRSNPFSAEENIADTGALGALAVFSYFLSEIVYFRGLGYKNITEEHLEHESEKAIADRASAAKLELLKEQAQTLRRVADTKFFVPGNFARKGKLVGAMRESVVDATTLAIRAKLEDTFENTDDMHRVLNEEWPKTANPLRQGLEHM